ncbi:hypothetical protein HHJ52_24340 (plasmid) [Escherichia coli]|nr:hypothetical protein HHJ52_24340 [Escherichia coli]
MSYFIKVFKTYYGVTPKNYFFLSQENYFLTTLENYQKLDNSFSLCELNINTHIYAV